MNASDFSSTDLNTTALRFLSREGRGIHFQLRGMCCEFGPIQIPLRMVLKGLS
jgi:hypothetical protein